jgi:uncharacterized protein YhaN
MKITRLDVEGFGVWSGLQVERFCDALNVFYGPNEAGKTTLLQFIRSMLYGFSPSRQHYLPPVHGGRSGGTLDVDGPHGRFQISRFDSTDDAPGERLTLTAPDGTRQGEHFVKVLLSNVDEAVFNNVFAVGLSEIQELATLSDTEAAAMLYNITAGLDRVSLIEVLQELEASRNRVLDADGRSCHVSQLLAEHEKTRADIEELGSVNHRYNHLAAEREQLHAEVTQLEEESNRIERLARIADLALAVRDRWTRRAALDEQLASLGSPRSVPEGAIERLDLFNARLGKHQQRIERLTEQRETLRREFAALAVNDSLWRQAARIEAFKEQTAWIDQLQEQIGELEAEVGRITAELAAEGERLGLGAKPTAMPELSGKRLASLRAPAKQLRGERRRWIEAKLAAAHAAESAKTLGEQIESSLRSRGRSDLAAALDQAGALVSQIRRRVQLGERLDQLTRHQKELEEQCGDDAERPSLPRGAVIGLLAAFVLGAAMVLAGLFLLITSSGTGLSLASVGLMLCGVSGFGKMYFDRSGTLQHEIVQRQLGTLQTQLQQAAAERDALDAQLPRGGGPMAARLQAVEAELAALEELAPLDTRRTAARQEAEAAGRRVHDAEDSLKIARRRWRESLAAAGLPETIDPQQAKRLVERADRIVEMQRRLNERREELSRRRKEFDSFAARIAQLASDAGVSLASEGLSAQLQELADAAARQEADVERREAIRREGRAIRAAQVKHEESISRLKHRRRALFLETGVKDEQEFRQRVLEAARTETLRAERDKLAGDIAAALGAQCSEDAVRRQFESYPSAQLEVRGNELRQQSAGVQSQLRGLLERRGRLSEQMDALAADNRLASRRLDLAVLEKRLADAVRRWQVLAAACRTLDIIRDTYQRHRQPETLQEASGYLERLTQGRYVRVWTPLGEHSLRVDDAEGHSLPVEALSRGTREQLFLGLRLALVSSYARRGAPLPLVLDDVLVNFDAERASAAASVLRDFAAAGHQLLVFTCHEHLLKMFKSLHVPVSSLPSNAAGPTIIALETATEEKAKRERQPRASRRKAAKEETPPEEESVPAEEESDYEDISGEDDALWEGEDGENFDGGDVAAA